MPVDRSPTRKAEQEFRATDGSSLFPTLTAGYALSGRDSAGMDDTGPLENQHHNNVHEVRSIKLPRPFWRDNAARYFTVAEMTFALHRITSDETKFRHIVINLDGDLLGIVGDIIDSPPAFEKN
ncbi:hypothetical protein X777_15042 [Ooceraea biroi]|uniref:DUF7041 domain-containing protein n=1 Tax=Ooceraea biroi TaxID=2015173 RepID=A0A026VVY5_OOCBI|nr:hypothetical protein X777_15042 [Ooceraea biroi]